MVENDWQDITSQILKINSNPKRKLKNQHPETMPQKAIMTQKTN